MAFLRNTSDGLVNGDWSMMVGRNMTKLKGAPEASIGSLGRLRSLCSIKVPPKALREEAIRGLRGTFLDAGRNHLQGVRGKRAPIGGV
jgi:hypothetical protein